MKNFNSIFNQLTAMPKRLAMVLTVLFTIGVGSMWGAEAEFLPSHFSGQGTTGTGSGISATTNGVTFACDKGFGTTQFRCYGGSKITISSSNTITEISFTFSGSYTGGLETSYTNLSTNSWEKDLSSQARITKCVVTYKEASADPCTVTLEAGSGSVTDTELTETSAGAGVTLPTATICDGWSFAGWATSSVASETTTAPTTLLDEGSNYKPTGNCTLYAVYKRIETTSGVGSSTTTFTDEDSGGWTTTVGPQSGTKDNVTISTNEGIYNTTNGQLRVYKGKTFTVTSTNNITSIIFTSSNYDWSKCSEGNYSNKKWTGDTKSVTFTAGNGQVRITQVVVTTSGGSLTTTYYHSTPQCTTETSVTLNPNGGKIDGNTSNKEIQTQNGTLTLPTPTLDGHTFAGWNTKKDGSGNNFSAGENKDWDADITELFAQWNINKYTITWKNGDNVLETDNNVEYGATPQYDGATPTKAATAQYTYAFTGWYPAIASVTKDQTYTAQFSQIVNKYAITWKNSDGTTLKTEEVAYGATPSYTGTTPTKAATEQYTYTHNGWTPSVVAVTGDAEYTATFAETPRTYTITLNTNGGTINAGNVTSYKYGTGATLPTNVTKEHHQFGGWFDNSGCTGTAVTTISTTATGNKEYWAKWTELPKYTVTWSVDGNTTTEEVYSGDKATKAPTIDENNLPCDGADKFVGWTTGEYKGDTAPGILYPTAAAIPAITGDITFYAVFADYAD